MRLQPDNFQGALCDILSAKARPEHVKNEGCKSVHPWVAAKGEFKTFSEHANATKQISHSKKILGIMTL